MAKILDGKAVAESIYDGIKAKSLTVKRKPKLVIIMLGENAASLVYIKQKIAACEMLGFEYKLEQIEDATKIQNSDVIELIEKYNKDESVTGMIVQMPLPEHLDKTVIIPHISPDKDVDGLTPYSYGLTTLGTEFEKFSPCTAKGVVKMLEFYKIPVTARKVVVVGSGIIAGKPIALMLSNRKATVTICNSKTENLEEITKTADILVVAVGKAKMITAKMVKKDAVVIDVGISRDGDEKISGDADFEALLPFVSAISPVPGGVGKLTVACLMENLLESAMS